MRQSLRAILRTPSVAAVAVLALGAGIGCATLVFSVTDAAQIDGHRAGLTAQGSVLRTPH